jgi:hypothetical protein
MVASGGQLAIAEGASGVAYEPVLHEAGSVILWWKPAALTGNHLLFAQGGLRANYNQTAGRFEFTDGHQTAVYPFALTQTWHFLAFTWGSNGLRIIHNPASETPNATASYATETVSLAGTLRVGGGLNSGDAANGVIDEFVVTSGEMEMALIRSIYESNAPVFAETSTWSFQLPNNLVYADEEGLWMRSDTGAAAFGMSGVASKSWGGLTLGRGDLLIGNTAGNYLHFNAGSGTVTFSGDGQGVTNINGANIQTGTVTANKLNFTPTTSSNVVSSINASTEGITINTARLNLTGVLQVGDAAGDVNAGTTTIDGGQITTKTITAQQISTETITADQIAVGTITATQISANTITATQIAAGTITADRLNVTQLSAITANLGTVTAGHISGTTIEAGAGALVLDNAGMRLTEPTTLVDIYEDADTKVGSIGMLNSDTIRLMRSQIRRTNIFPNPQFEDALSGWDTVGGCGSIQINERSLQRGEQPAVPLLD